MGERLIFIICLKQIFLNTTKFGGHKKDFGVTAPNAPVSAGPGQKVFHWGPAGLCRRA